jgi:hypothetical protein
MNKLSLYITTLFIICLQIIDASGQGYIPVTTQMRTPYGNVPHTYYVPSGMNYYYGRGSISVKYDFNVVLKNGEQKIIKSKINLQDSVHSLTYKENGEKKKLLPAETTEIYRFTQNGKKIAGVATDSCWLFKVVEGKINGYSFLSEVSTSYLSAFQAGDGEILPLTKDNLMLVVGDDPKRVKWVEKGNYAKAILDFNKE